MAHFVLVNLAVLCILIISSAKFDVAMAQQGSSNPYATVFLYSGRPNPRWQLSMEEWVQLNQLIYTLPKTADNTGPYQFHGDLGYSGFYAHFLPAASYPDIYYVANKQQAVLSNPGSHLIFADQKKVVQKWFVDSAKNHGIPIPVQI